MRRSLATLLLASFVVATLVGPAAATEPLATGFARRRAQPRRPSPRPSASPDPTAEPEPTPEPDPTVEPTPRRPGRRPTVDRHRPSTPIRPSTRHRATHARQRGAERRAVPHDRRPRPPPITDDPVADPTGRYLVMLAAHADTAAVVGEHRQREGTKADRDVPARLPRLHGQARQATSARPSSPTPTSSPSCPTRRIELTAQTVPTGVSRDRRPRSSAIAAIDGVDQRVDADIAIVDTGVATGRRPERRRRLQLLERRPWSARPGATRTATARTSPARSPRSTTASASSASRPGARDLGRPDPQRQRRGPAVVVRLRPRLDPRPARPERLEPAAVRGREHERHQVGHGRRRLRRPRTTTSSTQPSAACRRAGSRSSSRRPTTAARPRRACRPPTTRSSPCRRWPTRTASPAASAATAATRGAGTTATTRSPTSATTATTSTSWPPASASGRPCKDRHATAT